MPMHTAASDSFDRRSCEYHELPAELQQLAEAAFTLRGAWELLNDIERTDRQQGRHDNAHDVRGAEQSAYLAWQAAESAYHQIMGRLGVTMDADGNVQISADPTSDDDHNRAQEIADAIRYSRPLGSR